MRCPKCNSAFDAEYDYKSIQHTIRMDEFMRECPGHWKYWAFMPVGDLSRIVTMGGVSSYEDSMIQDGTGDGGILGCP